MLKPHYKWLALAVGTLLAVARPALAQDSGPLVDLLVKKGIVTDQEAEELRAELVKDFAANSSAGKLNLSSSLSEFRISGDVRVRYEYRQGSNTATPTDNSDRSRWRYRLRPLFTGSLGSQWFYGFRIENGTGNRSSNVTLGDDTGPWSKTNDGIYIGQVYVGFKPNTEWTIYAGRMPNPFVTTAMVWDGDINPEGFAEKFTRTAGNVTYFANFGQFIYDSANPQNRIGTTVTRKDQYLLGWQGGATFKLDEKSSLQIAPTIYNYVNNDHTSLNFAGSYASTNMTAINNLFVFDLPFNYTTALPNGSAFSIFGDVAYNFDGKDRARKWGRPDLDDEVYAWQLGAQYGKAKLKGEWDAKLYYQQTGLFSLDNNLVDSDIFDSRTNVEGVVFSGNYQLSDAVAFTLTYANGKTKDKSAISAGSGDLGIPTFKSYNLLQLDVVAKF
jgi:polyhydroxyalkanoate synthesis regulator phasin